MFHSIPGGNALEALDEAAAGTNIPLWSGSFTYQGTPYPFSMVGTDPSAGSAVSTVPVVIIPLKFAFHDKTTLSADDPICNGTESATTLVRNSPLFKPFAFAPGGTNVGQTQYADAFQRANFWGSVSTTAPFYHVLLADAAVPVQTVPVPRLLGSTKPGPCARIGYVNLQFFDKAVQSLITALGAPPGSLLVFLTYNTFFTQRGTCCIVGYHSATSTNQTYVVAAFNDPGTFNVPIEDVSALSHELGEWLSDPFGTNATPGWMAGQATHCESNLEVGDPLTGTVFTATLNGTTYHLQDLAFLPWFARESPSTAINGWYTFANSLATPPAVCQ